MSSLEKPRELNLTKTENKAYESWLSKSEPPVSPTTQAKFFELYLAGSSCEEIARLNPGFHLGAIVAARVSGDWDDRKDDHIAGLLDGVRQRVQQVTLESINFIADMLTAANKQHGDRLKKYIQTGDEKDLEGLSISSLKSYKEVVEMLMKLTGQDTKQKVSGEVLHHHTVAPASPLLEAKITADQASKLIESILEGEKK